MAEDGLQGLDALLARLRDLPERLQNRTLIGWTTATANRMAARLRVAVRPYVFKTGRTVGAIRGARVRPAKARSLFGAIARAIAFGSNRHGGALWGILNAGTAARYTKAGQGTGIGARISRAIGRAPPSRSAYRGRGPRLALVARFGPTVLQQVLPDAEQDLAKRIQRAFAKAGGE